MNMRRISLTVVVCVAAAMLFAFGAQADPLTSARVTPGELIWKASPLGVGSKRADIVGDDKKAGVYVYRVHFPAGLKIRPHFHPDERVVTVISGTMLMGYGDKFDETAMKALPAGSAWTEPPKVPHYVWAKDGEVVIQVIGANGPSAVTRVDEK
jgi:quercetin dioxygenase-like cupin family protein